MLTVYVSTLSTLSITAQLKSKSTEKRQSCCTNNIRLYSVKIDDQSPYSMPDSECMHDLLVS